VDEVLAPVYEIEEKYEGRAQKEFELGAESRPAADFALTVDVTTQIFADRETAASDLELLGSALGDAKFGECIAGFWETAFSSPDEDGTAVDFDVSATESMARAPRNGVSWAFAGSSTRPARTGSGLSSTSGTSATPPSMYGCLAIATT
jgi:hypothetical protein